MPAHTISGSESLPPLQLPPGALPKDHEAYTYDTGTDPPEIEPIEHRIRTDFIKTGPLVPQYLLSDYSKYDDSGDPWKHPGREKPFPLRCAEHTCRRTFEEERDRFFENFETVPLNRAPEYLATVIREARQHPKPEEKIAQEQEDRKEWYTTLIPHLNLYDILREGSLGTLLPQSSQVEDAVNANSFVGAVVVRNDTDPDAVAREAGIPSEYVLQEWDFAHADSADSRSPTDFGIELPAPLLVGEYHNGSTYAFLPWSDGLACSCPYKHSAEFHVACKHELLATMRLALADSIFLPVDDGVDVPQRARRFVSPDIFLSHEPEIPDAL